MITYVGEHYVETGQRLGVLGPKLYALIGAPNPTALADLVRQMMERGWLEGLVRDPAKGLLNAGLTLAGWDRYEQERRGKFAGRYGFLAMDFKSADLNTFVTTVLKPCVKEGIGYDLVDMRDVARAGIIDNLMREQIRSSAFVIVDLTHDNSGAYWEAGYAEGLGKPVVYICEKSKFERAKTHFDTNHCTTVPWDSCEADAFRKELVATLRRSLNLFPG